MLLFLFPCYGFLTILNRNDPVILAMGLFPIEKVVVDKSNHSIKVMDDNKIDKKKKYIIANLVPHNKNYKIKYNNIYFMVTDNYKEYEFRNDRDMNDDYKSSKKKDREIITTTDINEATPFSIENINDGVIISYGKKCITKSHKTLVLRKCKVDDLVTMVHQKFTIFTLDDSSLLKGDDITNLSKKFDQSFYDPLFSSSLKRIVDLQKNYQKQCNGFR